MCLKYWTVELRRLMVNPKVLFPPVFMVWAVEHRESCVMHRCWSICPAALQHQASRLAPVDLPVHCCARYCDLELH